MSPRRKPAEGSPDGGDARAPGKGGRGATGRPARSGAKPEPERNPYSEFRPVPKPQPRKRPGRR